MRNKDLEKSPLLSTSLYNALHPVSAHILGLIVKNDWLNWQRNLLSLSRNVRQSLQFVIDKHKLRKVMEELMNDTRWQLRTQVQLLRALIVKIGYNRPLLETHLPVFDCSRETAFVLLCRQVIHDTTPLPHVQLPQGCMHLIREQKTYCNQRMNLESRFLEKSKLNAHLKV